MTVPAGDNSGSHLTRGFEVVETDGDIQTRRLTVHQLNHRDTGNFNHFQRTGRMATFGEDQAIDIPRQHRFQALLFHLRLIAVVREHRLITMGVGDSLNAA